MVSFRSKRGKRGKRISYPISSRKGKGLNEYEITLKSDNPKYQGEYGFGTNPPIVVHARSQMEARRKITLPRDVRIVSIKRVGSSIKEKRPRNIDEEVAQVTAIERELGHPQDEDFTMSPSGHLGSKVSVGQVEGKFHGEFPDRDSAEKYIKNWMKENKFWPSVFWIDDHGGVTPVKL